jgi:hypothetical protein
MGVGCGRWLALCDTDGGTQRGGRWARATMGIETRRPGEGKLRGQQSGFSEDGRAAKPLFLINQHSMFRDRGFQNVRQSAQNGLSTFFAYTMRTSVPGRLERISESNRYAPPVCTSLPFVRHKLVSFATIPECHRSSVPGRSILRPP